MTDYESDRFYPGDIVKHIASGELGVILKQDEEFPFRWWVSANMSSEEYPVPEIALEIVKEASRID